MRSVKSIFHKSSSRNNQNNTEIELDKQELPAAPQQQNQQQQQEVSVETVQENNPDAGRQEQQEQQRRDFEDLIYISRKREIKVTVKKGAQAGVIAGLMVMGGVVVAGPVGAAVGGSIGTGLAMKLSKNVTSLNKLLQQTPQRERSAVLKMFGEAMKEEFQEGINENPELRFMLSGCTIFGAVRYMLDKEIIESEKLQKLDAILKQIKG